MIKRICDRCGKEVKVNHYRIEIAEMVRNGVLGQESYFDLCPGCFKEIFNFVEKENKQ